MTSTLTAGKVILAGFMAMVAAFGQNSQELRHKYGAPDAERFLVRPGIMLTVSYGEDGQPCELLLETWHPITKYRSRDTFLPPELADDLVDELVPADKRGKLQNSITFGRGDIVSKLYDNVNISRGYYIDWPNGTASMQRNQLESVSISWKRKACKN